MQWLNLNVQMKFQETENDFNSTYLASKQVKKKLHMKLQKL